MFFLFAPAEGNWNCKCAATRCIRQPKSNATTLIINVLILLAITRDAAAIAVPATKGTTSAETTLYQSNHETGAATSAAKIEGGETKLGKFSGLSEGTSPKYIQNYFRTHAMNEQGQQQLQQLQQQQQQNQQQLQQQQQEQQQRQQQLQQQQQNQQQQQQQQAVQQQHHQQLQQQQAEQQQQQHHQQLQQQHQKLQQQQQATSSHAYANYMNEIRGRTATAAGVGGGEAGQAATIRDQLSQFRLRDETLGTMTESGFIPTTMTAAGKHYATTAGIAATQSVSKPQAQTEVVAAATTDKVAQNHGLIVENAAPPGKVGYEINSENYNSDNIPYLAHNIPNEMLDAAGLPMGDLSATQKRITAASTGVVDNYYNYYNNDDDNDSVELFKNYFAPMNFQTAYNQYLQDLDQLELQASYQQQQQQFDKSVFSLPQPTAFDNSDLLQKGLSQQPVMQSFLNIKQKQHQTLNNPTSQLLSTASMQQQQQRAGNEKELQQHQHSFSQQQEQLNSADRLEQKTQAPTRMETQDANSDGLKSEQQDQTQTNLENNAAESSNQQNHYFYSDNDIDIEQQRENSIRHMHHLMQEQQQQFDDLQQKIFQQSSKEHPTLPPITNIEHHTPISSAAASGIPLHKHTEVTKNIPVHNYQQVHVPFTQKVPIEVPDPVITTIPRPLPIKIPVTNTVAVPQVHEVKIPVEKVKPYPVERPVPFLVDKRVPYNVERQVATPFYYPYPIKVPILKTVYHKQPTAHQHHHHHLQSPLQYKHALSTLQYQHSPALRTLRNFYGKLG